ncbi:oligoribonuclease [Enterobacter hormaechei]|uniref:oligoribonuclease n=1 Tax=Enterobacter hormaechei TaxID=158836 RepID=UPI001252D9D4|nr:oligoribonuclease [Enterobacter hormaechei]VAF41817.1 anaerobic C4-dicarboxylate transporter [Enterobacter hormaechei]
MITIEFIVIILCLLIGTRFGGMGLGLISGIGLFVLSFVFGLQPGKPPVDVMLTILAVIGCAATLQTAGGLNVMMQFAERLLRKHPQHITLLAPFTTWMLTFLCGTGHVVYTMFPIIADIALKKGIRPERPMAVASVASQMAITASEAELATLEFLKQWVPAGKSPICGNSIGQDRRFLFKYMPELESYFHYRYLDVSTLKELARRWKPEILDGFTKQGTHQAMDDIRESVAELAYYRENFIKL